MRVADYIAQECINAGIKEVFMVTGGAAMHLNDAFGRRKELNLRFLHHEQSCSMAAEAYARVSGIPALVNVTAGPGAINAINGVFGAYVDSQPMIIVSGQVKRETLVSNTSIDNLRQLGDQEVDIIAMVKKITKFAAQIDDPEKTQEIVAKAIQVAISGRPGPVWIDVPIDVQAATMTQTDAKLFDSDKKSADSRARPEELQEIAVKLLQSKRPILYVGNGIRLSGAYQEFLEFINEWKIPTVTGWNSNDLLWDDHPCYVGRPGTVGNRSGNFAVQYSDCLIVLGCRLNIRQVSYNWSCFADRAWICHIDIDPAELSKPTLHSSLKVCADLSGLLPDLSKQLKMFQGGNNSHQWEAWRSWGRKVLREYPVWPIREQNMKAPTITPGRVNPYFFVHTLTNKLSEGEIIVCADGTACVIGFQAAVIKPGQRLFHNSGCASMGYDIPAAIGAHYASNKRVICLAGDGSIMMNLQELAIIGSKKLPIIIYVLNNEGYHSIRQTQSNYFSDNPVGCGIESGLPFPSYKAIASGFDIDYTISSDMNKLEEELCKSLSSKGPVMHEIILCLAQQFSPKSASRRLEDGTMVSSRLEDMAPFLPRDEMERLQDEALSIE